MSEPSATAKAGDSDEQLDDDADLGVCGKPTDASDDSPGFQPFPTQGVLFANLDLAKPALGTRVSGRSGKVRSYKMISVYANGEGRLEHYGSGPNFQGDRLTLCTCAHQIRTEKKSLGDWRGVWVAGFTSPKQCGRTWLFYLAQIDEAHESAAAFWAAIPAALRLAKSSRHNKLGDAFEPAAGAGASPTTSFASAHYHAPMVGHSHRRWAGDGNWKRDIEFENTMFCRHSAFLCAAPEFTFLWQTPTLFLEQHPRNRSWESVAELIDHLEEA